MAERGVKLRGELQLPFPGCQGEILWQQQGPYRLDRMGCRVKPGKTRGGKAQKQE